MNNVAVAASSSCNSRVGADQRLKLLKLVFVTESCNSRVGADQRAEIGDSELIHVVATHV